jgi:hypothetical protein
VHPRRWVSPGQRHGRSWAVPRDHTGAGTAAGRRLRNPVAVTTNAKAAAVTGTTNAAWSPGRPCAVTVSDVATASPSAAPSWNDVFHSPLASPFRVGDAVGGGDRQWPVDQREGQAEQYHRREHGRPVASVGGDRVDRHRQQRQPGLDGRPAPHLLPVQHGGNPSWSAGLGGGRPRRLWRCVLGSCWRAMPDVSNKQVAADLRVAANTVNECGRSGVSGGVRHGATRLAAAVVGLAGGQPRLGNG